MKKGQLDLWLCRRGVLYPDIASMPLLPQGPIGLRPHTLLLAISIGSLYLLGSDFLDSLCFYSWDKDGGPAGGSSGDLPGDRLVSFFFFFFFFLIPDLAPPVVQEGRLLILFEWQSQRGDIDISRVPK